jgi:hypothetical protein
MALHDDLGERVTLSLQRDEAIVLYCCLGRELEHVGPLLASLSDPAERLAFEGLFHDMIPKLPEADGPDGQAILQAARVHLLARFR